MTEETWDTVPLDVLRGWWDRADSSSSVAYRGDQIIQMRKNQQGWDVYEVRKDEVALDYRQRILVRYLAPEEAKAVLDLVNIIRSLPSAYGTAEDLGLLLYRAGIRPPEETEVPEEPAEDEGDG